MMESMTQRASEHDFDYMRRLGEFKAASHRDALAAHLALSVNDRLVASEQLAKRDGPRNMHRAQQDDLAAFFRRARELGLCNG